MRLVAGTVGPLTRTMYAAYNGADDLGVYAIGVATSTDDVVWTRSGSNPVISKGTGFESTWVAQPTLAYDGTQYVIYYSGYNGTTLEIGRATAASFTGSWTKNAGNPVLPKGSVVTDPDYGGAANPVVHYDVNDTPKWKMWYHGFPSGSTPASPKNLTVCFADSSDGVTWTKHGTVIPVGSAGSFNDYGTDMGCVYKSGSTWYVFMSGYHDPGTGVIARTGWCTCTDPADIATYSALTQMSNYSGTVSLSNRTWKSNLPRGVVDSPTGSGYIVFPTFWNPTDTGVDPVEICSQITSSSLTDWPSPSSVMIGTDAWNPHSAENPSVIFAP